MAREQLPAGTQRAQKAQGAWAGAGGLFGTATQLARRAARTSYGLAKRLPGVDTAERELHNLEQLALTELGKRIDQATDPYLAALRRPAGSPASNGQGEQAAMPTGAGGGLMPVSEAGGELEPLRAAMAELLNRSIGYSEQQAREYLYAVVLRQLTPDEARMISALADGSPFPVVHIAERSGVNGTAGMLLQNMSSLGKAAGVTLPEHVPHYITRLCTLDLAELSDESASLHTQYEILQAEEEIRSAQESAKRPKVVRGTIRLSRFGRQFWHACDPAGRPPGSR